MNPTRFLSLAAVASAGILFVGCAAHTNLTPLGEGRLAPHVGIGGPIVEAFDTHIPVPYLMAGADYGIRDNVNLNGSSAFSDWRAASRWTAFWRMKNRWTNMSCQVTPSRTS